MHAAHRSAQDESQMVHAEPLREQAVVRGDHVVVIVLWETRVQAVAGLRGFSVADAVGKNDVVTRGVQKLARAEKFTRKNGREELMPGATGAVQDQNRVGDASLRVLCGLAQCRVMQTQLGQRFARPKLKILRDKVALRGSRRRGLLSGDGAFA